MAIVERERTSTEIVMYALYLYFLGLSFTSRALEPFAERSHVAVWDWVQRFNPKQIYPCKRIAAFLTEACSSPSLEHRLHSSYEKSLIERVVQCLKDRTEAFDDYYPCMKEECELELVYKWTGLFIFM